MKPEWLLGDVADGIDKLNGRPDSTGRCLLVLDQYYLQSRSEEDQAALRAAYEAIPEHLRIYALGDIDSAAGHAADVRTPQALVTAFLGATSEVPDDGDLETHLVVTNGARIWEPDDLETVTTATETDPSWLQLRSAINNTSGQEE